VRGAAIAATLADFGQGALLVDLGLETAADRAARTHRAAAVLRAALPAADVVIGAGTVLVEGASREDITAALAGAADETIVPTEAREHAIAAVYDGPDLEAAAAALGMTREALIARHAGQIYTAELLGFLPGFAYLGGLDPGLILPRRPAPRPVVAPGSIGVAGDFTGIYPFASPGGWNLIARALDARLFDPARDPPSLIQPGDRLRFVPSVDRDAAIEAPVETAPVESLRALRVVAAHAVVTVQDAGRAGQLHRGLPPSGALARGLLAAANAAVGNEAGAAGLEIPLGSLEIEAQGELVLSIDGAPALRLAAGERLRVGASTRGVRYLAVAGGIDVPLVLGARATLPVARLGGLNGRALRRGDLLPVGPAQGVTRAIEAEDETSEVWLDIDPGPQLGRFPAGALEALLEGPWQVSRLGDRVGVRLEGARVPRDRADLALPLPMRRGAVQVTTEGTPIILGPDHPTTGGYPVLAVLRRDAQELLARLRPGAPLRFRQGRP
jgi:KipI family sensor histidine kinase inhibitor